MFFNRIIEILLGVSESTSFFGRTIVSFAVMTVSAMGVSERTMLVMTRPLLSSMTVAYSFGMTLPPEN